LSAYIIVQKVGGGGFPPYLSEQEPEPDSPPPSTIYSHKWDPKNISRSAQARGYTHTLTVIVQGKCIR